jgi:ribosomal protein L7/L12
VKEVKTLLALGLKKLKTSLMVPTMLKTGAAKDEANSVKAALKLLVQKLSSKRLRQLLLHLKLVALLK